MFHRAQPCLNAPLFPPRKPDTLNRGHVYV